MGTIVKEVPWSGNEQIRGITLGNFDVLVAHFKVPADATPSQKTGSISIIPTIQGSAGYMEAVLAESPASFKGYRSPWSMGSAPGTSFVVGEERGFCARLEPGRDYYLNVRVVNPAPTQLPSDVFIEFHAPKQKKNKDRGPA